MKQKHFLLMILMSIIFRPGIIVGQETCWLEFSDHTNWSPTSGGDDVSQLPPFYAAYDPGEIKKTTPNFSENVPEEVKACVDRAFYNWETYINKAIPFKVSIQYISMDEGVRTEVQYIQGTDGIFRPCSLVAWQNLKDSPQSNLDEQREALGVSADGVIFINKDIPWNCNVESVTADNRPNLVYAVMKSIARIMGFGSSVRMNSDNQCYFKTKKGYTLFDTLISSNYHMALTDIALGGGRPNAALTTFLTQEGGTFYVQGKNSKYQFDKSPYSSIRPPLYFMESGLMKRIVFIQERIIEIDDITRDVLEKMGWEVNPWINVEIKCNTMSHDKVVSSTAQHEFHIVSNSKCITDGNWRLIIEGKITPVYVKYLQDQGLKCILPALGERDWNRYQYKQDENGLVDCVLFYDCYVGDLHLYADWFTFKWDMKPFLISPFSIETDK